MDQMSHNKLAYPRKGGLIEKWIIGMTPKELCNFATVEFAVTQYLYIPIFNEIEQYIYFDQLETMAAA